MTAYDEMPTGASCSNVMLMLKLMLKVCKVKVIGLNVVSNMTHEEFTADTRSKQLVKKSAAADELRTT